MPPPYNQNLGMPIAQNGFVNPIPFLPVQEGRFPNPAPPYDPTCPAATMVNSTGGVGCEPGYNYYFPGEPFNMNLHLILSSALIVSAMTVSLLTCDVGAVFDLVGATSACALAYVLPPLCFIRLSSRRGWSTVAAWAVVAFGLAVMCISVLQAGYKMISGKSPTPCPSDSLCYLCLSGCSGPC